MLVRKMMIRLVRIYRMMRRRKKILVMHYQFYTLLSNEMDEDGFIVVQRWNLSVPSVSAAV